MRRRRKNTERHAALAHRPYANSGTLMTHDESIALIKSLGAKFTPELRPRSTDAVRRRLHPGEIRNPNAVPTRPRDSREQRVRPEFSLADILYWVNRNPASARRPSISRTVTEAGRQSRKNLEALDGGIEGAGVKFWRRRSG
jgi:hypothetical protein